MHLEGFSKMAARGITAAALLTWITALPATAEEAQRRSPSRDDNHTARVERSDRGSASSTRPSSGSSSSGTASRGPSSSGSSSSGGDRAVVSRGSGGSHSSSPSGRTRVENRRGGDGSWHGGSGHGHHGGGHHGYYPRYRFRGWYGDPYYYWPWWWGGSPYPYGRWGYGYGPYGYESGGGGYYRNERDSGALDFDVNPERAEVYVDGEYVGVADEFGGFPSYLWLPRGTYDVVVYMEGFQTIARQYSIYPGLVIDVEDSMQRGDAVRPEDLPAKSTVNRDERLRRDREREEEVSRREAYQRREPAQRREIRPELDAREEAGRLAIELEPGDASVYLDGRFLGTAADLARLHSGLIVDPGDHVLEVVRPGYESKKVEFSVEAGEEAKIDLRLEKSDEDA